jgi:DNA polymerase III psi subunit
MMDDDFLGLLITEKLYLLQDQTAQQNTVSLQENQKSISQPVTHNSMSQPLIQTKENVKTTSCKMMIIAQHMTSAEQEMLQKILAALALKSEDVRLVENYESAIQTEKILHFTPQADVYYQVVTAGAIAKLYSPPLGSIAQDNESKKKLWAALKSWITAS